MYSLNSFYNIAFIAYLLDLPVLLMSLRSATWIHACRELLYTDTILVILSLMQERPIQSACETSKEA